MTESPFQARAREEAAEYSTYRAVANIFFEGALAYRPGHAVPVSNVRLHGYDRDGLVERVDGQPISPLPPALPTPAPESPEPVTQIDAPA